MRPEPIHILILVIVILLIFGAPKLPMIAKNLGKSLKVFKSEVDDLRGEKGKDDTPRQEITDAPSTPSVDDVTGSSAADPSRRDAETRTDDDRRRDV